MSNPIVVAGISLLWPAIALAITGIIGLGTVAAVKFFSNHPKTVPLADVVSICGQALDAAVKAAGGLNASAISNAEKAAFNVLAAHKTDLEADGLAELKALCCHTVALKAGMPITMPGGATGTMPTRAFAVLLLLPALLALALAALLAASGLAKGETLPMAVSAQGRPELTAESAFLGHPRRPEVLADADLGRISPVSDQLAPAASPAHVLAPSSSTPTVPRAAPLAALFVGTLVPELGAMIPAQIEDPPVPDQWKLAILTPGLSFTLSGSAPVSVAASSGIALDYEFGKYLLPTGHMDATGNPVKLPWFGVSLFLQGGVNLSNLGETENGAVGLGFILLDSVTFAWYVKLASTAVAGAKPDGILTGNMNLTDTGPEIFYSVSIPGAL